MPVMTVLIPHTRDTVVAWIKDAMLEVSRWTILPGRRASGLEDEERTVDQSLAAEVAKENAKDLNKNRPGHMNGSMGEMVEDARKDRVRTQTQTSPCRSSRSTLSLDVKGHLAQVLSRQ